MMFKKTCNVVLWAVAFGLFSLNCHAGARVSSPQSHPIKGFDALMALAASKEATVSSLNVSDILDFVASKNPETFPVCENGLEDAPMAYFGFDVKGGMDRLTRYYFNPDIPSCAVMPTMVRLSNWRDQVQGTPEALPRLWTRLKEFKDPEVFRSVYYMQNTPDPSTGAYYGYDSYRTVVLTRYKGQTVLISMLKQKDVSDVGRKGFILGETGEMDYFYSGEQGLNKLGLGWVKSYLYDSFSVAVFIENDQGVRCGVFKWLKAGWAGRNMVRKTHILDGLKRYADEFTRLMDSGNYPEPDRLAEICSMYNGLTATELKKKMEDHILSLQGKCTCTSDCPKLLKTDFDINGYIDRMSPMEMKATLVVDAVKHILTQEGASGGVAYRPDTEDLPVF